MKAFVLHDLRVLNPRRSELKTLILSCANTWRFHFLHRGSIFPARKWQLTNQNNRSSTWLGYSSDNYMVSAIRMQGWVTQPLLTAMIVWHARVEYEMPVRRDFPWTRSLNMPVYHWLASLAFVDLLRHSTDVGNKWFWPSNEENPRDHRPNQRGSQVGRNLLDYLTN